MDWETQHLERHSHISHMNYLKCQVSSITPVTKKIEPYLSSWMEDQTSVRLRVDFLILISRG